jgi:type I restriction enzyme S subunit
VSWPRRTLDELGFIRRGRSQHRPRNDPSLYGGQYPFIQTADIQAARSRIRGYSQTYNEKGLAQSKLWEEPTLCMTIAGENTAATAVLTFPACFPDSIVGFIPDPEKADIRFVKHALDTMKRQFRSVSRGATQDNLSLAKILSFPLSIPSLSIQQKIASIVAAYDDLVENNLQRIVLLEEAARMLYREWFVHFRFPGHEHVKIIDGIPEGWERRPLGDLAVIRKGKNITKESAIPGTVPVVAGGLRPAYYHDTANAAGPVITISASGANAGYVGLYHEDIWASDCSFLSASGDRDIWLLFLFMKHRQTEITAMQQGAAQPHVYPKHLERLKIEVSPQNLRELFHETVSDNFTLIANLEAQNKSLTQARDLFLPRLMNGEIAV